MAKSGYNEASEQITQKQHSLSSAEQEVCINMMRTDDHAMIYASDSTYITKLDKLCETSPDYYSLVEETSIGKIYRVSDKSLISFRQKKREMSEEAKEKASERFKELHAEGKIGRRKKII